MRKIVTKIQILVETMKNGPSLIKLTQQTLWCKREKRVRRPEWQAKEKKAPKSLRQRKISLNNNLANDLTF